MKRRILIPLVLTLLLIVALAPAAFALPFDDTVIESDEVVNNDVIVLDGDLVIHQGAVVNGDVVVFAGDATIDGVVSGSVTLFNGDLHASETTVVEGECILLNGEVSGPASLGNCTAVKNLQLPSLAMPPIPAVPSLPNAPLPTPAAPVMPALPAMPAGRVDSGMGFGARAVGVMASTLLFTLLGLFVGAIMPNQLRRIVATARAKPMVSGLAGVLTAVAVPSLIVLLIPLSILLTLICIGLLGFPIMILLALGLVLGSFLGWIVVGTWLGLRLYGGKEGRIVRAAALGTGTLTLIFGVLGLLPLVFGESLLAFVVVSLGLGAVTLTQFGLKPYPRQPHSGTPDPRQPNNDLDPDKVDIVLGTLPPEDAAAQ